MAIILECEYNYCNEERSTFAKSIGIKPYTFIYNGSGEHNAYVEFYRMLYGTYKQYFKMTFVEFIDRIQMLYNKKKTALEDVSDNEDSIESVELEYGDKYHDVFMEAIDNLLIVSSVSFGANLLFADYTDGWISE